MKESTTTENIIEVRNLSKGFGDMKVLDDLSFELRKGENLVILGKSGTGKSVTIKCIVRLLDADSGVIDVLGNDVNQMNTKALNEIRQKIGFLFQSGALYDSMTVRQNLEFPLRRIKKELSDAEIDAKVKEALENVGLPDAIDKMPSELSGGMRKRISLARTIIVDPEIMLYDEPTTGLDPVTSHEISILINDIQKKYKTSSIIITHDIECAKMVANRVIMLKEGKVYKEGKISEFETTDDELISAYFQSQNIRNLTTN
ncbi:MAG: ABC transporter ATP-binding protein [Flavobacterium sp. BFFFF1]|uniref:ABC transporter ATP-binding protein n=1 Tax=Flavobacterium sp. BFFFF1 TaxID=2015557 RepID=UPI000BD3C085|nr:ATP-binding cassette domain-containing protein [Flavobacterium sp. BFFFF1]OYU81196.1 MAG: ABC transporter ATP-binding protein [Flavobacterium sp. BFFFF1]